MAAFGGASRSFQLVYRTVIPNSRRLLCTTQCVKKGPAGAEPVDLATVIRKKKETAYVTQVSFSFSW